MSWTDDPHADYDRWEREQQKQIEILPTCAYCSETLEDDLYDINGEILCEECMNKYYKKDASEYIQTEVDSIFFDEN